MLLGATVGIWVRSKHRSNWEQRWSLKPASGVIGCTPVTFDGFLRFLWSCRGIL